MSLTRFQQAVCRLIAANRLEQGEAYVAGGVALNLLTGGKRLSRDIDLFHDTLEALDVTWHADRRLLESHGYELRSIHERPGYVEAVVSQGADTGATPRRNWRAWLSTVRLLTSRTCCERGITCSRRHAKW
jgi:hypothetical protein